MRSLGLGPGLNYARGLHATLARRFAPGLTMRFGPFCSACLLHLVSFFCCNCTPFGLFIHVCSAIFRSCHHPLSSLACALLAPTLACTCTTTSKLGFQAPQWLSGCCTVFSPLHLGPFRVLFFMSGHSLLSARTCVFASTLLPRGCWPRVCVCVTCGVTGGAKSF